MTQLQFIGRKNELNKLENIAAPGGVIITGGVGIGKTRLVEAFLAQSEGKTLVSAICRPDEAYAPFADILGALLNKNPALIPKTVYPRLLSQVPALSVVLKTDATAGTGGRQDQLLFFGIVLSIISKLNTPVIILDDAHLIDPPSLHLLHYLLKYAGNLQVILAARDDTPLSELPGLTPLPLPNLTQPEIGQLIEQVLDGTVHLDVTETVTARSQGNPLFAIAIAEQLKESKAVRLTIGNRWLYNPQKDIEVAPAIKDVLAHRMEKILSAPRRDLAVAALIGYSFSKSVLVDVLGKNGQYRANQVTAIGMKFGLMTQRKDGQYHFTPPEITKILTEELNPQNAKSLHRDIAEALSKQPNAQSIAPAIVAHYQNAVMPDEAAKWAEAAARRAAAVNDLNKAIEYAQKAHKHHETLETGELLADLYRWQGNAESAIDFYRQAQGIAAVQSSDAQARVLNKLALTYWLYDRFDEALTIIGMIMALPMASPAQLATADSNLGMVYWQQGRLTDAKKACENAVKAMRDNIQYPDPAALSGALNRLGLVYLSLGQFVWARASFEESLKHRRDIGDMWGQAFCINNLAKVSTEQGHFNNARGQLNESLKIFESIESKDGQMVTLTNMSRALIFEGKVDEAQPLLKKALWLALDIGKQSSYGLTDIHLLFAEIHLQKDNLEEMSSALDAAGKLAHIAGNQEYIARTHLLRGRWYAKHKNERETKYHFEQALRLFKAIKAQPGVARANWALAHLTGDKTLIKKAQRMAKDMGLRLPVEKKGV